MARPSTAPDSWSIGTRHRVMLPLRLLVKYRWPPSGAQTGCQSIESSVVTATGAPPVTGIVQMSPAPAVALLPQYAMRCPFGDQAGCAASPSLSRRASPPSVETTHIWLLVKRSDGSVT